MKTLTYSASFFEEEEGEVLTEQEAQKQEKQEKIMSGLYGGIFYRGSGRDFYGPPVFPE